MSIRASLTCILLATAVVVGCGGEGDSESPAEPAVTGPLDEKGNDLFVLRGPAEVADGRIEVTTDVVEWFNDRPQRNAGVAETGELVDNWQEYGFETEPPNAALAGEESDGEVELMKPEATDGGVSFAYKTLRGEIGSEDGDMTVFIDSSEWETDMHVRADGGFCDEAVSQESTLRNPQVVTQPGAWSLQPQSPVSFSQSDVPIEIFTAASTSGSTSFEVTYDLECDGEPAGTVSMKGHVPDNLNSDSFSCSITPTSNPTVCVGHTDGGYHVNAYAEFQPK